MARNDSNNSNTINISNNSAIKYAMMQLHLLTYTSRLDVVKTENYNALSTVNSAWSTTATATDYTLKQLNNGTK